MRVTPEELGGTPDDPRSTTDTEIVSRKRIEAAVARIDRIASIVLDAPPDAPMPALRAALAQGAVPDTLLASSALQLLHADYKSSAAPALVNCIEDERSRREAAIASTKTIIATGSDKWAFKFALAMQDEFVRIICAHAAIAYIVELGIRNYANSCLLELHNTMYVTEFEHDLFLHALYQRGGRPLVERWLGWQRERAEQFMQREEADDAPGGTAGGE